MSESFFGMFSGVASQDWCDAAGAAAGLWPFEADPDRQAEQVRTQGGKIKFEECEGAFRVLNLAGKTIPAFNLERKRT